MGDLNPGFENIPWGLQITALGMGTVFVMLAVLWFFLWAIAAMFPPKPEEDEEEEAPAPVAAKPAAAAVSDGDLGPVELAAIAVALQAVGGPGGAPALVANQSGTGLAGSTWVAVGRSLNNQTWQRRK
jgi:sodium pump decarboxylase gamma subunit